MLFRIKEHEKQICRALITITLCIMWGHSAMNAEASSEESGAVIDLIAEWLGITLSTTVVRKGAHMLEYAVLAGELAVLRREIPFPGRLFPALSFCGLAALIDETIQYFPEGRAPMVTDVWIDLAGGLIGALAVSGIISLLLQRKKKLE